MDIDSEFREAQARLSINDTTDEGLGRRELLKAALAVGGGAAAAALVGADRAGAQPVPSSPLPRPRPTGGSAMLAPQSQLLLIQLGGGNDGWNTLVPMTGQLATDYVNMRGQVGIANPIRLDRPGTTTHTGFGLHPSLPYLASEFTQGRMCVVQGVGYANSSLSHFDAIAKWMAGSATAGLPTSGWIGRWLDAKTNAGPFDAIQVGAAVPLHMVGNTRKATAAPDWEPWFGTSTDASEALKFSAITNFATTPSSRGALAQRLAGATNTMMTLNRRINPLYTAPTVLPDNELARRAVLAARLFNANLGTRVISTVHGDFDQHDEQLGTHATRLTDLNNAIEAFYAALDPAARNRTLVVTFSEFGRKPWANGSRGTDHGTASVMMVVGSKATAGIVGTAPVLTGLQSWEDPVPTVDFRSVYSTLLKRWIGINASVVLGGSYAQAGILKAGPSL